MFFRRYPWILVACLAMSLSACGNEQRGPARDAVYPVTGQIYVNGELPPSPIAVGLIEVDDDGKPLPKDPTKLAIGAFCDLEGKFSLSTYEKGDGAIPGKYVLTFFWGRRNLFSGAYGGADTLEDLYYDAEKSKFPVTVVAGQPADMGRIDLEVPGLDVSKVPPMLGTTPKPKKEE